MSQITKGQNRQYRTQFGAGAKYIVDSTHALPAGVVCNKIQVLVTTATFACVDASAVSGSGAYPAVLTVGTEIYGTFSGVSVSAGTLICTTI